MALAQAVPIRRQARAPKLIVATGLLATVAIATIEHVAVRTVEAQVVTSWLNWVLPGGVVAVRTGFMINESPDGAVLFDITAECTTLLLIAPLVIVTAALTLHRRTTVGRALLATLTSVSALILVNQVRFGLIAWATQLWGLDPGYEISHRLVGTVFSMLGFAGALLLGLFVLGVRQRGRRHES